MAPPLSKYVRGPIRDYVAEKYADGGLKAFAKDLGVGYTALFQLFSRNKHVSLEAFIKLADELGVKPDELAPIIELPVTERLKFLQGLCGTKDDINDYCSGTNLRYLYAILRGQSSEALDGTYLRIAKKTSLGFRELYSALVA